MRKPDSKAKLKKRVDLILIALLIVGTFGTLSAGKKAHLVVVD